MACQFLLLAIAEKVAIFTIHRPDKGNALAPDVKGYALYAFL